MNLSTRVNSSWRALKNKVKIASAILATAGSALLPPMAVAQTKQPVEQNVGAPEYVEGQVMVQFKEDPFEFSPELAKSRKSPYAPISTQRLFDASAEPQLYIKDASLEDLMNQFKVSSVQPLTPGAQGARANAYLLKFSSGASVEQMADSLTKLGLVRKAHPDMVLKLMVSPPTPRTEEFYDNNVGQLIGSTLGIPGEDLRTVPAWARAADAYNQGNTCISYLAIMDTGGDVTNLNLAGRIDTTLSYNFFDMNTDITDVAPSQHGTKMALEAAGSGPDGSGIAWPSNVKIIVYKVDDDSLSIDSSKVVMALNDITLRRSSGVNITTVNSSFGGTGAGPIMMDAYADADGAGVNLVMSGGNDPVNQSIVPCNGWIEDGRFFNLCVTGLDNQGVRADYTRGVHINSATFVPAWAGGTFFAGTSSAAALMSGAVALARSINPTLTKDDVYALVMSNLRTPPPSSGCDENSPTGCSVPNLDATSDQARQPPYCTTSPTIVTNPALVGSALDVCAGQQIDVDVFPNPKPYACGSAQMRETLPGSSVPSAFHSISRLSFPAAVSGNLKVEVAFPYEIVACYQPIDVSVNVIPDDVPVSVGNTLRAVRTGADLYAEWADISAVGGYRVRIGPEPQGLAPPVSRLDTGGTSIVIPAGSLPSPVAYLSVVGLSGCSGTEGP